MHRAESCHARVAKITVGMPVFNAMPWLEEAVDSLLRQTEGSFELLVIVDGATDGSVEYLRSVRDERIRIVEQRHAGVTATLNQLLAQTRTEWLIRQDADDVSYPQRICRVLDEIHSYPDAGVIYSLADYHPRNRCRGRFRCSRGTPEELRAMVESGYLLSICHSTVALHVQKVRAAGGYRMDIHAEDADLWWRMARRYPIRYIPEPLVGFRQSAGSLSAQHAEEQQVAGLYVQYLLLSEKWGLPPRPLSEIAGVLGGLLRPQRLLAKERLRQCNLNLAREQYLGALASLLKAFWASPGYLVTRAADEWRRGWIVNGVSPELFLKRKEVLWE